MITVEFNGNHFLFSIKWINITNMAKVFNWRVFVCFLIASYLQKRLSNINLSICSSIS